MITQSDPPLVSGAPTGEADTTWILPSGQASRFLICFSPLPTSMDQPKPLGLDAPRFAWYKVLPALPSVYGSSPFLTHISSLLRSVSITLRASVYNSVLGSNQDSGMHLVSTGCLLSMLHLVLNTTPRWLLHYSFT